uniref:Uncharacterized protein n=1 Tax=Stutzerimonas stutzeri TaxID=316 RepID=Q9F3U0_STUST|nr:hypothetical protein [Stutzerimonas stutzeri]
MVWPQCLEGTKDPPPKWWAEAHLRLCPSTVVRLYGGPRGGITENEIRALCGATCLLGPQGGPSTVVRVYSGSRGGITENGTRAVMRSHLFARPAGGLQPTRA